MSEEEKQFILSNIDTDVTKLLLNPPKDFKERITFLTEQIQSRQKAKDKLPTWYANPDLIFPSPLSVEQCSSEATANYKAELLGGTHLIDLTGGMGVDTLTFADHFQHVTYVEQNEFLCSQMEHNAQALGKNVQVINDTAESFLAKRKFDSPSLFFIDPARRDNQAKKVFRFADCSPNINDLLDLFREIGSKVMIKAAPLIDLSMGIEELQNVEAIHVISVKNDCKEVLFLLDFQRKNTDVPIRTINLTNEGSEIFDFTFNEERASDLVLSDPKKFLLLPNASILKAGAFKSISTQFGISKIGTNTHFYTSDELVSNFPGRTFEVLNEPISKQLDRANVISRNHPLTPQQILKKFRLKEGGNRFILAFRDQNEKPQIVLAQKI